MERTIGKGITLQELFRAAEFDAVLKILIDYDPEISDSKIALKQSFDCIRTIEVGEDDSDVGIEISFFNDKDASEGYRVRNCNPPYKVVAGRPIVMRPSLQLSCDELATYCLWGLTYWGYSDKEVVERLMSDSLRGEPATTLHEKPRNGPKRKRDVRRKLRLRQLRRYAKINELCEYLTEHSVDGVTAEDLLSLKNVAAFTISEDHSFPESAESAERYMCELYKKYGSASPDTVRSIAIVTGGSAVNGNLDNLKHTLATVLPNTIIGIGDRRENQITVLIISVLSIRSPL